MRNVKTYAAGEGDAQTVVTEPVMYDTTVVVSVTVEGEELGLGVVEGSADGVMDGSEEGLADEAYTVVVKVWVSVTVEGLPLAVG